MEIMREHLPPEVGEKFVREARRAVQEVATACGEEHAQKGVYLRFFRFPQTESQYRDLIRCCEGWVGGCSNREKFDAYYIVSMEKAIRLARNPQCISSYEAERDPSKCQYGGAIRTPCWVNGFDKNPADQYLTSVSGLTELGDEAAALLVHNRMGWITESHPIIAEPHPIYEMICMRSNNQLARRVLSAH